MIQTFVDKFMAFEAIIKAEYTAARPSSYDDLVKRVIQSVGTEDGYDQEPDPERIHIIDDGDYQGTRLYVVAAKGYQPSTYWTVFVDYGSCSGCDAFEAASGYSGELPVPETEVNDYWAMMLHMVQSMKQIGGYDGPTG